MCMRVGTRFGAITYKLGVDTDPFPCYSISIIRRAI